MEEGIVPSMPGLELKLLFDDGRLRKKKGKSMRPKPTHCQHHRAVLLSVSDSTKSCRERGNKHDLEVGKVSDGGWNCAHHVVSSEAAV